MDVRRNFLLGSDFDQTLRFNDPGVVLSELIGLHSLHNKVEGLAEINLVQQGAELSYLILHDPDCRRVRRGHFVETGRSIRLKDDVALLARVLDRCQSLCWKKVMNWNSAEIRRALREG
jgi:hypothetical protein